MITFAAVQSLKKTNLSLRCEFSPEELTAKAESLANATVELQELKEQKRNVVAEFGELIKEVEGRARALSKAYRSKGENRFVECAVLLDTPEKGKKSIVRLDLNRIVKIEAMTDDDRQDVLPLAESVEQPMAPSSSREDPVNFQNNAAGVPTGSEELK